MYDLSAVTCNGGLGKGKYGWDALIQDRLVTVTCHDHGAPNICALGKCATHFRVKLVSSLPPPSLITIAEVDAKVSALATQVTAAMLKIDDTVMGVEQSFGHGLEAVRGTVALGLQTLSRQVEVTPSNSELQAAMVRMSAELTDLRSSLSSPAVFWVRIPASTATAFLVAPTVCVVDGLRDAVKLKVPEELAGVSVLRLQVWGHDAVSKQWVPVDEDAVLVANDKATAYHVVVLPKACF